VKNRHILIIYTGGTIGMTVDKYGQLVPCDFRHIIDLIPEISRFDFNVNFLSFSPLIDSSNMSPSVWIKLVGFIEKNYHRYDGFVILHGTDTMAYTASALSFMLENLTKPVVLTGSQLPLGMLRTDGKENVISALEIAAAYENEKAMVPEVSIYFQNELYRGNRTTKYDADNFNAFKSVNYPPIAEAGVLLKYHRAHILSGDYTSPLKVYKEMDDNIVVLKLFPGINKQVVHSILNAPELKGVVLETYGSGNGLAQQWFLDELKRAIDKDITVLNVTQCVAGAVDMHQYQTGSVLLDIGVVSGYDSTTEAALTKLMFLLANMQDKSDIITSLNKSIRGEINI